MFLELPYYGMNFQGDPNMGLPTGYVWGPVGMIFLFFIFFMCFCIFLVFYDVCIYMCTVVTLALYFFLLQMWEQLDDLLLGWWDTNLTGGF